ncbi:hypothetical protein E5288_WYG006151 [Bos mutus]|uniref:Uncharacterized protein n=1 Tax=Bos mutus TaxID=72004 RepID=A0A6B0QXT3_9CETA|nr:hypothetical protein [Bos mutus]
MLIPMRWPERVTSDLTQGLDPGTADHGRWRDHVARLDAQTSEGLRSTPLSFNRKPPRRNRNGQDNQAPGLRGDTRHKGTATVQLPVLWSKSSPTAARASEVTTLHEVAFVRSDGLSSEPSEP